MAPPVNTEDLIDAHRVAEILGLAHRNTVSVYQRRYAEMPRPVLDLGPDPDGNALMFHCRNAPRPA